MKKALRDALQSEGVLLDEAPYGQAASNMHRVLHQTQSVPSSPKTDHQQLSSVKRSESVKSIPAIEAVIVEQKARSQDSLPSTNYRDNAEREEDIVIRRKRFFYLFELYLFYIALVK